MHYLFLTTRAALLVTAVFLTSTLLTRSPAHAVSTGTATGRALLTMRAAYISTRTPTMNSVQWQQQTPPNAGAGASDLHRIACPSTRRCVIVGEHGLALTTADGGQTWQRHTTGTRQVLTGVSCPTDLICYAVGAGSIVLATANSGRTWHAQRTPAPASLVGIACPVVTRCIAVGDAGALVLTSDGGHTWLTRHSSAGRGLAAVSCPGKQVCYAVGSVGVIAATRDGGQTWQNESLPLAVQASMLISGGSHGTSQRMTTSVARAQTSAGDTPALTDVACPTVTICYASGGQVVLTKDGGRHWTVQPLQTMPGRRSFWSTGIACMTPATCYLVGEEGSVLLTIDGGRSWSTQVLPVTQPLHSITCPGARVCYAVGDKETIVRTSNVPEGEAGGTSPPGSTATVTSTPAATADLGTALVAGTPMTGGFSEATPTPGPDATTVPASGQVTLGVSSRGKTITLRKGATIVLDVGAIYVLGHITYDPAILTAAGLATDGNPALRAIGTGTTTVTATASPRCRQSHPACGLPSLLLTYTVHVVSP